MPLTPWLSPTPHLVSSSPQPGLLLESASGQSLGTTNHPPNTGHCLELHAEGSQSLTGPDESDGLVNEGNGGSVEV